MQSQQKLPSHQPSVTPPHDSPYDAYPLTTKKKKKDKKRKDKRRSPVGTPMSNGGSHREGSISSKHGDDPGLSESELESKRAALLAQLNEQIDE